MPEIVVPYETATSGERADEETKRLLRSLGCDKVGFMEDFGQHELILAFVHKERNVQFRASARGWQRLFLKKKPWSSRMRVTSAEYERRALSQGMIAIHSIIRDWVKGNVTAIECEAMSFEEVFLAHIMAPDGRRLIEVMAEQKLLPPPGSAA